MVSVVVGVVGDVGASVVSVGVSSPGSSSTSPSSDSVSSSATAGSSVSPAARAPPVAISPRMIVRSSSASASICAWISSTGAPDSISSRSSRLISLMRSFASFENLNPSGTEKTNWYAEASV